MPAPGEAIFAVASTAGWVAHVLEEYWVAHALEKYGERPPRMRPRGQYVGPRPPSPHPYRQRLPSARGNGPSRAGRLGSPV